TIAESGLPGYDASTWGGILAPARTPKDTVGKLNGVINAALKQDDVRGRLTTAGIEIQGGTPGEFGKVIQAEVDKWGRIVKEAGIQPEEGRVWLAFFVALGAHHRSRAGRADGIPLDQVDEAQKQVDGGFRPALHPGEHLGGIHAEVAGDRIVAP